MNRGTPPTAYHARTGLLTPPGMHALASANSLSDVALCMLAR